MIVTIANNCSPLASAVSISILTFFRITAAPRKTFFFLSEITDWLIDHQKKGATKAAPKFLSLKKKLEAESYTRSIGLRITRHVARKRQSCVLSRKQTCEVFFFRDVACVESQF